MAEVIMRSLLRKRKVKGYSVKSAGLCVREGSVLSPESAVALKEKGYSVPDSLTPHALTEKLLKDSFVVVCMTESQRRALAEKNSHVTSAYRLTGKEVTDPYGQGIEVYRQTLAELQEVAEQTLKRVILPDFQANRNN